MTRVELIDQLFTGVTINGMKIKHSGMGNCTRENVDEALVAYARSILERAVPEEETNPDIILQSEEWMKGWNACRLFILQNGEKLLNVRTSTLSYSNSPPPEIK